MKLQIQRKNDFSRRGIIIYTEIGNTTAKLAI